MAANRIHAPWFIVGGLLILLMIVLYFIRREGTTLLPFFVFLFFFVAAFGYFQWIDGANKSMIESAKPFTAKVEGKISSPIKIDGDRAQFHLNAHKVTVLSSGSLYKETDMVSEKVQIFVKLRTLEEWRNIHTWHRGMNLTLRGEWEKPMGASNPGAFDYREYLRYQKIHWVVRVKGATGREVTEPLPIEQGLSRNGGVIPETISISFLAQMDRFRNLLESQVETIFPSFSQAFMKGLLLGTREDLEPSWLESFSLLGLTHILAISGLHVGLVVGGVLWITRKLGFTRERSLWLTLGMIPFYVLITGGAPSAVRAGLMAMIGVVALLARQWKNGLSILGFTGCVMVIWNPYYVFNIGFQLSFLTTIGILWAFPKMNRKLPIRPAWLRSVVSITLIAQWFSFPLSIYYFNQFSLLSFIANLVIVPIISLIILPLGYLALFIGWVHPGLAYAIAKVIDSLLGGIYWVVNQLSNWGPMHYIWATPSVLWMIGYYILFYFMLIYWVKGIDRIHPKLREKWDGFYISHAAVKRWWVVPVLTLLFIVHIFTAYFVPWEPNTFKMTFIDVGQGDSILLETFEGHRILIDGGGTIDFSGSLEEWRQRKDPFEVGKDVVVPYLKHRGIRYMDWIVATHGDTDHIGGLPAVIDDLSIGHILWGSDRPDTLKEKKLFQAILERKIPIVQAVRGQRWKVEDGVEILILHPSAASASNLFTKENDQSLVLMVNVKGKTFLLTGDIESNAEEDILRMLAQNGFRPSIDVMKVAHHGSKTSTSRKWLDFFQPDMVVISVGRKNRFGHPADEVMDRLVESNATIYRTDQHGAVTFTVNDKGELRVVTEWLEEKKEGWR
jgi:competence protein ComEC